MRVELRVDKKIQEINITKQGHYHGYTRHIRCY